MKDFTLGQKIKSYREAAGMSQLNLELAIDASPGSLSRIESGRVNPTKETIQALSKVLELSPSQTADLFNIDFRRQVLDFISILRTINSSDSKNVVIDILNKELLNKVNIYISMIALKSRTQSNLLEIASVQIDSKVRDYIESVTKMKLEDSKFDINSIDYNRNIVVECFLGKKYITTNDLHRFTVGIVNPFVSRTIKKLLSIKKMVAVRLEYKKEKLGVLSLAFTHEYLTKTDEDLIIELADQLAALIYELRAIDKRNE